MKPKVSGFVTFNAMYTMANIDAKIYVEIEIRSKCGKCYDYTDESGFCCTTVRTHNVQVAPFHVYLHVSFGCMELEPQQNIPA